LALASCGAQARKDAPSMDAKSLSMVHAALDARAADFVPVNGLAALPENLRADSEMWCQRFFAPAADPHLVAKVALAARAASGTPDLLRHEYAVGEFHVVAIESRSFTVIRVSATPGRFDALADDAKKAFVQRAAESLLNLRDPQHSWTLPVPDRLPEGVRFSTNPDQDLWQMASWTARLDGGVLGGSPYFLLFKKVDQILGFYSDEHWFEDDAFRASVSRAR
jgi:hypothetical protein